jgi:arylsulfatase A-like enzyme
LRIIKTKSERGVPGNSDSRRSVVVLRFTLAGATFGLLAGLFEAAVLYTTPREPGLLQPDASFVIWFLAPLMGVSFLGFVGLALGSAAAILEHSHTKIRATLGAAGVGIGVAYAVSTETLLRIKLRELQTLDSLSLTFETLVVTFVCSLILTWLWSRWKVCPINLPPSWHLGLWGRTIAGAIGGLLFGVFLWQAARMLPSVSAKVRPSESYGRPNIVLITLDTVRADHFSTYGYHRPTTPNLDRLAAQGVLFEDAIATTSWTLPSHASMFTGLLPHQHGANASWPLDSSDWTVAEVLRRKEYETVGFNANYTYGLAAWGLGDGFDLYQDGTSSVRYNVARTLVGRIIVAPLYERYVRFDILPRHNAREVNREVVRWLRGRSGRPFFLFINYLDAHDPYHAPPPFEDHFGSVPDLVLKKVSLGAGLHLDNPLTAEGHASVVAAYDNCLAFLDAHIGRLLKILADTPALSNTVVIVTADHGEALGEHGVYGHGVDLHREVLHVPLIMAGPGIPAGRRIDRPVSLRELFPTVLDLALGEKVPFRRFSLRRFWTGEDKTARGDDGVISELSPYAPTNDTPAYMSLMNSKWHFICDSRGRVELYHWPTDPYEKVDLAEVSEYQNLVQSLRKEVVERVSDSVRPWRGSGYLFALDRPGYSFVRGASLGPPPQSTPFSGQLPVGASQAYFVANLPSTPSRSRSLNEEMLRSLPYQ